MSSNENEKTPFFNDECGELYVKAFYQGEHFGIAINENNANDIFDKLAGDLMMAVNYTNKTPEMHTNDVHWEFTDFIVKTALWHKELDKSTEVGTLLDPIRKAVMKIPIPFIAIPPNRYANYNTDVYNVSTSNEYIAEQIINVMKNDLIDNYPGNDLVNPLKNLETKYDDLTKITSNLSAIIVGAVQEHLYNFWKNYFVMLMQELRRYDPNGHLDVNTNRLNDFIAKNKIYEETNFHNVIMHAIKSKADEYFKTRHTTLQNENIKNFWKNTFMKWNSLSDCSKKFYRHFIELRHYIGSGWERVNEADLGKPISEAEFANYRMNLTKPSFGSSETLFQTTLPKLPKDKFNAIWYTDKNGNHRSINAKDQNDVQESFFRDLYGMVYREKVPDRPSSSTVMSFTSMRPESSGSSLINIFEGQAKEKTEREEAMLGGASMLFQQLYNELCQTFDCQNSYRHPSCWNLDVEKLVRNRLLNLKNRKFGTMPPKDNDSYINFTDKNIWKRNEKGELYRIIDGKQVTLEESTKHLRKDFKCYSTLVNFKTPEECDKYVYGCLTNENENAIETCIQFWGQRDFFNVAKNEISNMNPRVALITLEKFGFRIYSVMDSMAGCVISKVESVDHWLKKCMETKFNKAEVRNAIRSNDRLLAYLRLLVEFVNSNPRNYE